MNKESFCTWIKEIREEKISRKDMASKYPWHENTIKAYEKDRLPELDYLYALSVVTNFSFRELVRQRLKTGLSDLQFPKIEKNHLLNNIDQVLQFDNQSDRFSYLNNQGEKGALEFAEVKSQAEIYQSFPSLKVEDDAMEPTIKKGALCTVDHKDTKLSPGAIYGFSYGTGKSEASLSILRRVQSSLKGAIILVTDNPTYPAQELSEELKKEITVIGRIKSVTNTL